jgi:hypothetical protein
MGAVNHRESRNVRPVEVNQHEEVSVSSGARTLVHDLSQRLQTHLLRDHGSAPNSVLEMYASTHPRAMVTNFAIRAEVCSKPVGNGRQTERRRLCIAIFDPSLWYDRGDAKV